MRKTCIYVIVLSLFSIFGIQAQNLDISGVSYRVDTLENHQVGPGTQYVSMRLTATGKRMDVYFLKADLKNPYVEIRAALSRDSIYGGETVSSVAKRKSTEGAFYFAGTNGDFYDTGTYVGYPVSGNMIDGEIAKIPGDRNVFVIDDQKIPEIGKMGYKGTIQVGNVVSEINSVNHSRNADKLILFNQLNGKYTHTNSYGTEVLVELLDGYDWGSNKELKAKVLKIEKNVGNMSIPKGKAVLSGHGIAAETLNTLSENDEINITLGLTIDQNSVSNFLQMTGGDNYATMLLNGVVEETSVWNELHPRTGLGFSQAKDTVVFCVVDGRGVSNGATTKQLAELMKSAGAYTAFNMDGGGSSTMYVAEYGKAVNKTSDGNERAVANSIFVVSNAPTDTEIGIIKPYKSSIYLPQYGESIPQFYGYNQYGTLLNSDLQGVVLSCPESLGVIVGNKFIATGTTPGNIIATYNGNIVTTIAVDFLPVSEIKIRLDSVIVDNRTDYAIEVVGKTTSSESLISPEALSWTVDNPEICIVEKGAIKALKNGRTKITGHINDVVDDLLVNVEIPETTIVVGDSLKASDWKISASSFLKNVQLNQDNLPKSWNHGAVVNFTHAGGRAPFIKLSGTKPSYGLPDTIKMVLNIGDMLIDKAIFTFKSNDAQKATIDFTSFEQNKEFSLSIPVDKLFDVNNRGIYPIWFDNVNFYLNASGMTPDKAYALAVKEIALYYNNVVSSVEKNEVNFFQVYPNPVRKGKELIISLNEEKSGPLSINVFDMTGRVVHSDKWNTTFSGQIKVSTDNLQSGVYFLQLSQKDKTSSTKVIVGN